MDLSLALAKIDELLGCPTPERWLQQAPAHLPELLIDHANCEKKAASTAMSLLYRYRLPADTLSALSKLAREELRHFEQVLALLSEVGISYAPLSSAPYAAQLRQLVAAQEPARLVDTLLVCAIVEARSCERFGRLVPVLEEPLAGFYQRLLASEARHFELYLALAEHQAKACELGGVYCSERLVQFLKREAELMLEPAALFRFHSGALSAEQAA